MEFCNVIMGRRSIRKYKSGVAMTEAEIKTVLEAAMMAPSAKNTRPWEFVVLKSEEAKNKALEIHPYAQHLRDASIGIIVCARPDLQEGAADGFFPQDCGAAIENILLSAFDLGYGSCWCGIYPREERVELFKTMFDIEGVPMALVVIGKSDQEPEQKGFYEESKVRIL